MAHTKAGGSTRQKGNRRGKHLGIKVSAGEKVSPGNILVRQRGSEIKAGQGTKLGRDFTIYSLALGKVEFKTRLGQKFIQIIG